MEEFSLAFALHFHYGNKDFSMLKIDDIMTEVEHYVFEWCIQVAQTETFTVASSQ